MTRNAADRLWLAAISALSLIGIGVLWPLTQTLPEACPAIYPVPQSCTTSQPQWGIFVCIGLVLCLLTAAAVVYFVVPRPRVATVCIASAIVVVCVIAVAVALTTTGGTIYPVPPVVVNQ